MQVATRWRSAARTDPGKVRARNEDAFLDIPEHGLWVVADGMGGHLRGDRASRLIVESLAELPMEGGYELRVRQLRQCLHWLNRRLGQELTVPHDRPPQIMGSTVAALLLEGDRAACVWAGDSRCYLWRGSRLYQLTRDHSLQQQLIDEQGVSPDEARKHPSAHALTRAVGASDELALEVLELKVHPGDVFLLCSDGLYQAITQEALGLSMSLASPRAALERLFDHALQGPARDNLTAVVIRQ
ncbi:serine/threonine-protein phosphatase [Pseudomonas sp. ZM23]|uniref:Serine/threonine-protein phosphatase n=1 Tax=Pseudomonas triclosanedens TaxID=2961893 RepID=A0ABY7A2Z8_9PSED|nr:PP2C family serine/threonine-protein phosphatase [Pseudomonas triclosanedens]MCP8464005.1 serine/threonine-protein phosphatase [Pseudomonas triclosanedens]MCP8469089.1 serine/threonine-protein phosphatase [Pseudomonas triclosanedens]MCP8475811.1 serine/threonine-protein phosphatase [Pseudomonas triclosanedens]WAI50484.1 serine/threonine-protein phosphatase [Pseudomonas triclosanedens]